METSTRQRELLATDDWAWLGDVIDTWYAQPLSAADGCSDAQLADVESTLGISLPRLLAEWYELVGNRLEEVQDHPVGPEELGAEYPLVLWWENQGVWAIGTDADGLCASVEDDLPFHPTLLPLAVHGLVMSDTLVGAWSASGRGPLGELAETVQGGIVEDISIEELASIQSAFPERQAARNPFFNEVPLHGDSHTFLRGGRDTGFGLEWMSASEESRRRIEAVLPLDPPDGEHVIELTFEQLTPQQRDSLLTDNGAPDPGWVNHMLGGTGHVSTATAFRNKGGGVAFRIATRNVASVLSAIDTSVPTELVAKMVVAAHPARVSKFQVLRPEETSTYHTRF